MPTATQLSSCKLEWRGYVASLRQYAPKLLGEAAAVSTQVDGGTAKSKGKAKSKSKKAAAGPVVESHGPSLEKLAERYDDISRTVPVELGGSVAAILECMLYAVDEGDEAFAPPPAPAVAKAATKRRGGSRGGSKAGSKAGSRAETPMRSSSSSTKQSNNPGPAEASSVSPQSHWELAGETFEDGDQLGELVRWWWCCASVFFFGFLLVVLPFVFCVFVHRPCELPGGGRCALCLHRCVFQATRAGIVRPAGTRSGARARNLQRMLSMLPADSLREAGMLLFCCCSVAWCLQPPSTPSTEGGLRTYFEGKSWRTVSFHPRVLCTKDRGDVLLRTNGQWQ